MYRQQEGAPPRQGSVGACTRCGAAITAWEHQSAQANNGHCMDCQLAQGEGVGTCSICGKVCPDIHHHTHDHHHHHVTPNTAQGEQQGPMMRCSGCGSLTHPACDGQAAVIARMWPPGQLQPDFACAHCRMAQLSQIDAPQPKLRVRGGLVHVMHVSCICHAYVMHMLRRVGHGAASGIVRRVCLSMPRHRPMLPTTSRRAPTPCIAAHRI